ncbi:MAG TPA: hypothetical protein VKO45_00745, partial [Methanomicrobiales archaeon]|nr:hypothetical protein [Methanomicrobiales archaeon]
MKSPKTVIVIMMIFLGIMVIFFTLSPEKPESGKLRLSDYPRLFGEDTIIIIGKNASSAEADSAATIS